MNLAGTALQYAFQSSPYLIAHLEAYRELSSILHIERNDIPLEITADTVNKDSDEEDGVEVGDGRASALAQTPRQAHNPVGDIVRLARVRPPAIDKQPVTEDCVRKDLDEHP